MFQERRSLASPDGDKDADPLLVSLLQEGSDMMADLRHLNLKPQHCYRNPDPINLYHKVGHGKCGPVHTQMKLLLAQLPKMFPTYR